MMNLSTLPNQLPNEKVVLKLRRHWIVVLRIVLLTVGLLLVPTLIGTFILSVEASIIYSPILGPALAVALGIYLLLVAVLTATNFTDYWLDVWIVTTERLISTEQIGLFNRVISEVRLQQIQDITSETHGFFQTFLTYGDVYIQTAAERERFHFETIDNPDDVKITIGELTHVCKNEHHHPPAGLH